MNPGPSVPSLVAVTCDGLVVVCDYEQLHIMDVKRRLLLDTSRSSLSSASSSSHAVDPKPPPKALASVTLPFSPSRLLPNPAQPSRLLVWGGKHCSAYLPSFPAENISVVHVPVGGEEVMCASWVPDSLSLISLATPSCLRIFDIARQPPAVVCTVMLRNASIASAVLAAGLSMPPDASLASLPCSPEGCGQLTTWLWAIIVGSDGRAYR